MTQTVEFAAVYCACAPSLEKVEFTSCLLCQWFVKIVLENGTRRRVYHVAHGTHESRVLCIAILLKRVLSSGSVDSQGGQYTVPNRSRHLVGVYFASSEEW